MNNILNNIPVDLTDEHFDVLADNENVTIERIVSRGHTSPAAGWYDQNRNEWVMVVSGEARLAFEDGTTVTMRPGDYINIDAHRKHRVTWTAPDSETVWLAIHY